MRLAIIGSRDFTDYSKLCDTLIIYFCKFNFRENNEGIYQYFFDTIISGGAKGADSLAARFAKENNIKLDEIPADWYNLEVENRKIKLDKNGRQYNVLAGFNRNIDIVTSADFVLAFWDSISPGTADSLKLAKKLKKSTLIIYV